MKDAIQVWREQRTWQETGLKDKSFTSNETHRSLLFTVSVATS